MLHSKIHWPDSAVLEYWPFAMDHAVYLWNALPRKDTFLLPSKLYTINVDYIYLQHSHVSQCPVYILDPQLQNVKNIPKWKMHSMRLLP
jgi:hypothetical protein